MIGTEPPAPVASSKNPDTCLVLDSSGFLGRRSPGSSIHVGEVRLDGKWMTVNASAEGIMSKLPGQGGLNPAEALWDVALNMPHICPP